MIWRKLKLDWSYAIGELLIVIAGVLIALAIDQWNDDRLERLEELDAVARILVDVERDLRSADHMLKRIAEKETSLLRVREVLAGDDQIDSTAFLTDIVGGANFGWNQRRARRSTYDNLIGSGKLGIISDQIIAYKISSYYRNFEGSYNRIDERETEYPALSYRLVPRSPHLPQNEDDAQELSIESGLSDAQLDEIVELVQASSIGEHVLAELNLARFIRAIELDRKRRAEDLISDLEAYQQRLQ